MTSDNPPYGPRHTLLRAGVAVGAVLVCLCLMWAAARAGASRLYSGYGMATGRVAAADVAARLSPADPEAFYARAALRAERGRYAEAARDYERAIALRPRDYVLWVELGRTRDQLGETEGALAAFGEAARLAPFYARPRWQAGNVLLRAGRREEALAELRRAAASSPRLFMNLVDLAWNAYGGDVAAVERAARADTRAERLILARFYARAERPAEAVRIFRSLAGVTAEERKGFVRELVEKKQFAAAFAVWSDGRAARGGAGDLLIDGGFEGDIQLDGPGFGWQLARDAKHLSVSLDAGDPREGARSLRIDFKGDAPASSPALSQLVPVEPQARYRLTFAARTEEIVTGGPPLVSVSDAGEKGAPLARSKSFGTGTNAWQSYTVEFATGRQTGAVRVALQRQSCTAGPCPAFGRVWLDGFSLQRIGG